jgi:hypothetical protein
MRDETAEALPEVAEDPPDIFSRSTWTPDQVRGDGH